MHYIAVLIIKVAQNYRVYCFQVKHEQGSSSPARSYVLHLHYYALSLFVLVPIACVARTKDTTNLFRTQKTITW